MGVPYHEHPPLDHPLMGWTGSPREGYPEAMKPEELRRYEEEFKAIREMLGTYYLELSLPTSKPETASEGSEREEPGTTPGLDTHPRASAGSSAPLPSGHG